ncbi:hypothetical protein I6E68_13875 [Salinibacterium sp. NSLL150]|uniref:hypothetical protein n=1 Tax=unclassified Salinibacterium TaxID=2632331 RepID=UPI0018CEFBEA|nr:MULTISPECIES: hypothetical protein [unclassified Salinibacterium]MBH0100227.1 hypothetical protein [Salinibacterium sp. NSLL35]MBH0102981.1 hypothetical protein [Salinibacterium sp. NSLL150]MBH0105741.1 hypothetical protein [Salinibacterium sp. NSLL16]MBH0108501.1 hypothetical protein [Salinibacterium sp. NSLL17]
MSTVTGCASVPQNYSSSPVVAHPSDIARPIDGYMLTVDEILTDIEKAEGTVNDCLASTGVDHQFTFGDPDDLRAFIKSGVEDRKLRGDIWGFFDPASAEEFGYQRPQPTPVIYVADLPEVSAKKCGHLIQGDNDPLLSFSYASLPDGGPKPVFDNENVVQAIAGWSACMTNEGYTFATPLDPLFSYVQETKPSPRQIAVAMADLRCKRVTNLIAAVLDAQVIEDETYILGHEPELRTWRDSISDPSIDTE